MSRRSNELLVAQKLENLSETKKHFDTNGGLGKILVQVIDVLIRRLSSMVIPEEDISNVDPLERYDPEDPFKQVDKSQAYKSIIYPYVVYAHTREFMWSTRLEANILFLKVTEELLKLPFILKVVAFEEPLFWEITLF